MREDGLKHARRQRARVHSHGGSKAAALAAPVDASDGGRVKIREDAEAAKPSSSDEVGPGGWVRRKTPNGKDKGSALGSSLSVFRMKPRREQKEFQVLAFFGTGILTPEERAARRIVSSIQVNS